MSPFLVFLNAARNLASMGMKREQVLDFAQREFGELTELMKAQIDNIYKPKKGAPSQSKIGEFMGFKNYPKKDEVFDDTVVKMKFDDEGKPFNPRDPLKNLSKKDKDKKADGGRIGLRGGDAARSDAASGRNAGRADPSGGVERPSGGGRDDDPSNNFRDTTTKKRLLDTVVKGGKNFAINKAIEKSKFGKFLGPKGAAILGILGAIRGSTKKSPPGNLSMLDEEGIGSLPESNLLAFEPGSIKDKQLKQMYNIFEETGMQDPRMKGLMQEDIKQGGPLSLPEEAYQTAADGGRIGLKDGLFPFPMKKDGFLISPDTDKLTEEQKMYIEGMKIQEKKRQEAVKKFLDKLLESQPESERGLKPVPMPKYGPDDFKKGLQSLAGGGRVGFKGGMLARLMEGVTPDGGVFQSLFANRKHPILSTFNSMELLEIANSLGPFLGFNKGGRVGLKDGMDRRKFLKIMGGLASLPVVGKFLKFAKPAAPVAEKVVETVSQAPTYFFDLVTKIKAFGKQSKVGPSERVDEYTYIGKNGDEYTLTEDIVTGDAQIVKDKMGVGSSGDKTFDTINDRSVMEYKAPRKDVDPDTQKFIDEGAEYDEYRVEFDMDGTEAGADAIEETIQKEIIEEAKKSAPPIKKAAGGLAYMLGE